jgi:hypothetical protein
MQTNYNQTVVYGDMVTTNVRGNVFNVSCHRDSPTPTVVHVPPTIQRNVHFSTAADYNGTRSRTSTGSQFNFHTSTSETRPQATASTGSQFNFHTSTNETRPQATASAGSQFNFSGIDPSTIRVGNVQIDRSVTRVHGSTTTIHEGPGYRYVATQHGPTVRYGPDHPDA